MNENEKLLGNLINAVQKGLQSGKLDITDMQYLQEHLDLTSREYMEAQSAKLAKSYHKSLNENLAMEEQAFKNNVQYMRSTISALKRDFTELEQNIKALQVTKWVPLGVSGIAVLGALLVLPLVMLALGTMWSSLYQGLLGIIGNNWFLYLLFAVLGIITMLIFLVIFAWLYAGFNWIYERYFSK